MRNPTDRARDPTPDKSVAGPLADPDRTKDEGASGEGKRLSGWPRRHNLGCERPYARRMSDSPSTTSTCPVPAGTVIAGKYRVGVVIASGGMGVITQGRHEA